MSYSPREETEVTYTVKMFKRIHSSQPWIQCGVNPSIMGKMRKVVVEFENVPRGFQLCVDIEPVYNEGNKSILVLCKNSRVRKNVINCYSDRTWITNSFRSKTFYLKPKWISGESWDNPIFNIIISINDVQTCKTGILHEWETEIHGHKAESNAKVKSIEGNACYIRGSIYL